jgi:hypothetical protein
VSILSSTLTPTIHPTFPLRFVSYDSIFTNPATSSPDPDMVVDMISTAVGSKQPGKLSIPQGQSKLTDRCGTALSPHSVAITLLSPTYTSRDFQSPRRNHVCCIDIYTGSTGYTGEALRADNGRNGLKYTLAGWGHCHEAIRRRTRCQPDGREPGPVSLHTMTELTVRAKEVLANVKKAHGPHSTLLVINSQIEKRAPPASPDVSTHPAIPLPRPFSPDEISASSVSQVYASALSSLSLSPMSAAMSVVANEQASQAPGSPSLSARKKLYGQKLTAEDTQR